MDGDIGENGVPFPDGRAHGGAFLAVAPAAAVPENREIGAGDLDLNSKDLGAAKKIVVLGEFGGRERKSRAESKQQEPMVRYSTAPKKFR